MKPKVLFLCTGNSGDNVSCAAEILSGGQSGPLATAVSKLRKVLGEEDTIIKTIPKVGCRLAVTVRCGLAADPTGGSSRDRK